MTDPHYIYKGFEIQQRDGNRLVKRAGRLLRVVDTLLEAKQYIDRYEVDQYCLNCEHCRLYRGKASGRLITTTCTQGIERKTDPIQTCKGWEPETGSLDIVTICSSDELPEVFK